MKNVTYDRSADAAYFRLKDTKVVDSETISPGVVLDYDDNDDVVGIEILSVRKRTLEELKNINYPLKADDEQSFHELLGTFSPATGEICYSGLL
jgi:uncharacterized protein YuzE